MPPVAETAASVGYPLRTRKFIANFPNYSISYMGVNHQLFAAQI